MSKKDEYIGLVDYHLSRLVDIGAIDEGGRSYALTEFAKTPEENMESYSEDLINEIERIVTTSLAKMQGLDTLAEDVIAHTIISQTATNQQEEIKERAFADQQQKLYNLGNNRSTQPGQVLQLSDLISPNAGVENQPQARTSFAQSSRLADESKESVNPASAYPNLPSYNSNVTAPPVQKVPFPVQPLPTPNYPSYSQQTVQNPYPLPQNNNQFAQQPPTAQSNPIPTSTYPQVPAYPQVPNSTPRPGWRPGSNLIKPPTNPN